MKAQLRREVEDLAVRAGEENEQLLEAALLLILRASRILTRAQKGVLINAGQQILLAFPEKRAGS